MLALAAIAAAPATAQITTATVTGGAVQGGVEDTIGTFKGIPFAAPPVGTLRWNVPQPVIPWTGAKQATSFGPACVQDPATLNQILGEPKQGEDCLYLNVWTPAKAASEKRPVMVWIYGGGFTGGATSSKAYDGHNLAKKGVVLVSVGYRLGSLGWLAHAELSKEQGGASGNYGLHDQIAALKWVKANIAKFGGDPANVTIFGESAGGIAVAMLATSPLAKGLYAKAISESGGNFGIPSKDSGPGAGIRALAAAEAQGRAAIEKLGAKSIAEARLMPVDAVQKSLMTSGINRPIYDGKLLPAADPLALYDSGKFNDTPVLIGSNSDEGSIFGGPIQPDAFEANIRRQYGSFADRLLAVYPHATPEQARQAQADLMRDTSFGWPTLTWARKQTAKGRSPAYIYYFDYRTARNPNGAVHVSEVPYVFGNFGTVVIAPPADNEPAMREQLMTYWVNFARTGNPNGAGAPDWPKFTSDKQQYMSLGDKPGAIPVPHPEKYKFFDDYYAAQRAATSRKALHPGRVRS